MNHAEKSLFVFGIYLILAVGAGFIFIPTILLDLFGLAYGDDTWIRFVGLLAFLIGGYYVVAALEKLAPLFIWTVRFRFFAAAFMVIMLALGKVGQAVLIFAAIDAAGASWTWFAMKKGN